uniref:NADH-ubiquinone oxidoreductase chain 2 n=1 Tax=Membranipora grandicella TaxID=192923 RepID=I6M193_9BILA|nr:NADH dehydrogenase subunit 2 [Membranipora grandicella]AEH99602.1 NADH dehydrogenase subunit 2 [Membranipora grandicella]
MKYYPSFFFFMIMIIMSLFMVFSSTNWFMLWLSMETALLGFLPLFNYTNSEETMTLIKYFILQSSGSILFLAGLITSNSSLFMSGLLMKLGLFPFFFWVPSVLKSISWAGILMLTTLQKLPAMGVLISPPLPLQTNFMFMVSVISILISSILGFNQSNIRMLMAYSSISQTAYMLISLMTSAKLFLLYFFNYLITMSLLIYIINKNNVSTMEDLSDEFSGTMNLLFMNLMGMPPFPMFFMKMFLLFSVMNLNQYPVSSYMIILCAMSTVFMYMNMIMSSSIKNFKSKDLTLNWMAILTMMILSLASVKMTTMMTFGW